MQLVDIILLTSTNNGPLNSTFSGQGVRTKDCSLHYLDSLCLPLAPAHVASVPAREPSIDLEGVPKKI